MSRLSVSLEEQQSAWVAERSDEFGISKGKVVRECIESVRTGESLFTTSVNNHPQDAEDRLDSLESRLQTLESKLEEGSSPPAEEIEEDGPSDRTKPTESIRSDSVQNQTPAMNNKDSPSESETNSGQVIATDSPDDTRPPVPAQDDQAHDEPDSEETDDQPAVEAIKEGQPIVDPDEGPQSESADDQLTSSEQQPLESADSKPRDAEIAVAIDEQEDMPESGPHLDKSEPDSVNDYLRGELSDDRAAAVFACWKLLEERGTVHSRAFKELQDRYPLGYGSADDWWAQEIQSALESLPGVTPPEPGGSFYRFKY